MSLTRSLAAALAAAALVLGAAPVQAGPFDLLDDFEPISFGSMEGSVLLHPFGFSARSIGPVRQPGVLSYSNTIEDRPIDDFEALLSEYDFDVVQYSFGYPPVFFGHSYEPWSFGRRSFIWHPDSVTAAVPEPSAALVFALGSLLVGGYTRARGQKIGSTRLAQ